MRSLLSKVWRWGGLQNSLVPAAQLDASNSSLTSVRHYIKQHPAKGWKNLTSKRGNQNFWKGRGVQGAGANSSKGQYRVLPSHTPHYILPDMRGCNLTPYVGSEVRPPHKKPKVAAAESPAPTATTAA